MTTSLFWTLLISPLTLITGCKQKENKELSPAKVNPVVKKFALHLDLSFESSNYYDVNDTGFVLMDRTGNYIKPFVIL